MSIYADQLNHLDTKCFPVIVRYFSKFNGISIKIVDFRSILERHDIRESVWHNLEQINL